MDPVIIPGVLIPLCLLFLALTGIFGNLGTSSSTEKDSKLNTYSILSIVFGVLTAVTIIVAIILFNKFK